MLIDRSYFVGELNIVTNGNFPLNGRLDAFIEKYETELLKDILGYGLYKAYINGVQGDPVDSKWTDLIAGAEYQFASRTERWGGLVTVPAGVVSISYASNATTIVVGRGLAYDPVSNSTSVTIPPALVGKSFTLEQRSFGELRSDEYSVSGSTLTLSGDHIFSSGDTYFYKTSPIQFATTTTNGQRSLIANYIYYKWMKDQATQSTSVGEVATKTENSSRISPAQKMVSVWNEMSEHIHSMWHFLDNNRATYPEWYWCAKRWSDYRPINVFGI